MYLHLKLMFMVNASNATIGPLDFVGCQDTIKKMCSLVSIQLVSDAVVFAGNQEACEHAVKFLEAQIKHLGRPKVAKKTQEWKFVFIALVVLIIFHYIYIYTSIF